MITVPYDTYLRKVPRYLPSRYLVGMIPGTYAGYIASVSYYLHTLGMIQSYHTTRRYSLISPLLSCVLSRKWCGQTGLVCPDTP